MSSPSSAGASVAVAGCFGRLGGVVGVVRVTAAGGQDDEAGDGSYGGETGVGLAHVEILFLIHEWGVVLFTPQRSGVPGVRRGSGDG
jgi:hypothetical protein